MTQDEFLRAMDRFSSLEVVKSAETNPPHEFHFELYADVSKKDRRQALTVELSGDAKTVLAYSYVGECPDEGVVLRDLLEENLSGHYSRLARLGDRLVQVFKYELSELGAAEMAKALDEVSRYADMYERKYFGGRDIA